MIQSRWVWWLVAVFIVGIGLTMIAVEVWYYSQIGG